METGFSIDDVRDTLTQDVTRLLGRIERAAREILDDPALALGDEPAGVARFLAIGDHSHAIHGTSCLVSAQSLADSSARMQTLAHHGRDQLTRALRHLASARDIAAAMADGSTDMLSMLSHELDGKPAEAQAIADSWRLRVEDVLRPGSVASAGESTSSLRLVPAEPAPLARVPSPPLPAAATGPADIDDGWGGFDDASEAAPAPPPLPLIPPPPAAEYSFASSIAELPPADHAALDAAIDPAIDPDLAEVFAVEASTTLTAVDDALAALATRLDDRALLKAIERGFHTLKGAAATVGLAAVSARASDLQDLAELLVEAGRPVTASEVAGLIRDAAAMRQLAGLPAPTAAPPAPDAAPANRIAVPVPDPEVDASFQHECADLLEQLDRTALALERSDRPHDPIGELLRGYHTMKGVVNALGLEPIGDQLHRVEDLLERLTGSTILPPLRAITGALLWFHGELRRQLATVRQGYVELEPDQLETRLTRLVARSSQSSAASATGSPASQRGSRGSRLGDGSEASAPVAAPAPDRRSLRVSIDRLDALMNLAGELVISRSRLLSRVDWLRGLQVDLGRSSRHVLDVVEKFRDEHEFSSFARGGRDRATRWSGFSELELDRYEDVNILARSLSEGSNDLQDLFGQLAGGLGALTDDSDALGTIIAGIQGEVTRTRMVPLDTLFSRLELPVRDAAQRADREVRVETIGADVHLDKTIADALFQPMLHLVRNAVSHGIEPAHARVTAGKPAHGTITLSARQELGQIVVEVTDDGAGLDLERLRERGAALGLVDHDTPLDDPRIRELIFVHGLSTQVGADAVAGRGVGCDVVRRAVDRLNGSLRVETVRHQRTVFSITLPVTLAITRALLVRNAGETFAVPLYFTERIIDAHEVEVIESAHQRRIELDDAFVPVRPLGAFTSGATSPSGPILVLAVGAQQLVVQVDEVVTQEEIVVKSLGPLLRGHPMFAGVTIRGTGETVLILDVPSMTDSVLGRRLAGPAADPVAAPAPAAIAAPAAPDRDRPLHVLFVDDSVSVRKVAERALKQLGVEVTLATDGADALDKLRGGRFDLVFTDLEMPRMHGYELIRELRFLPAFQTLPVVVVTSRSGKKHRDEAHTLGASEYLTKPFTARSLAAALVKFGGPRAARLAAEAFNEAHHDAGGGEATP
ncbi:MAG TPA: response regulator [Kofleriaceae bacterium]|jgi:chemosensory pili system protein ChpA (sensor histidine kinase/response regulator)|nr:response regulator [Kofleriaceae bacterium]